MITIQYFFDQQVCMSEIKRFTNFGGPSTIYREDGGDEVGFKIATNYVPLVLLQT